MAGLLIMKNVIYVLDFLKLDPCPVYLTSFTASCVRNPVLSTLFACTSKDVSD